jgi:uncharacterized protein YjbI with pentapeptide repeats
LSYANLARTDLRGADLAQAKLANAYMFLTQVAGVDLSSATGLNQEQLDLACGDAQTKLPQGLVRPAGWPCTEASD